MPKRQPRLARRDRVARDGYNFALAEVEALEKSEPLVADEKPTHVGQQSNHLRF